ncbi:MAG TPA: S8 family serine peptidase [Planctomycetota bacterium]|nr:S8 family serine peptidase [Planctomycetota bacterium]
MQLPSRRRLLGAAMFALISATSAPSAQWETEGHAQSEPVHERIDPRLQAAMDQLAATGVVREGDGVRRDLRVVIELVQQAGDPTFETSTTRDPVPVVRDGVALRQAVFLDDFARTADARTLGAVRFLGALEYQYMLVAEVADGEAVVALAQRDDVKFVWNDNLNRLFTVQGRQVTGSDVAASQGHTGAGVGVAVIDTRFDLLHTELGGSTALPNSVVKGGYNYSTPGAAIHSQNFNDCYHGTGTASIVRRYAPGVHLYALVVFPNAYDSVIANAINWCVTNKNGTGGGSPIRVISMSLGGGGYTAAVTSGTLHTACGTALANGILPVAATGNDGYTNRIALPAASTNCISVGSTWDANSAPYSPFPPANCSDSSRLVDERACYSNMASFMSLYAPSEQVICAQCGGGTFALGGTSSATPAAAGLIAQFLHARPAYVGNLSGVKTLFHDTGVSVLGHSAKRRVNLPAAITAAGGGGGGPTALANGTTYNYSVATGAVLNYTIAIPANATNLVVTITGTGDADLYVKRLPISWPAEQGMHNEAEFKAPYIGGSAESVTFPAPAAATWNVLVHGYSAASGTIRATWSVGGGGTWTNETWVRETPHNYSNNQVYTYTYTKPGASQVAVHFERITTEANYDFVRIKNGAGTVLWSVSGNVISNGAGSAFGQTNGWAIVAGNTLTVELTTDYSVTAWGLRTDVASYFQ